MSAMYIIQSLQGRLWGYGAAGSASPWHGEGQGFESPELHDYRGPLRKGWSFLLKRRCFADVLAEPQKRFKVIETGYMVVKKQDFHDDAENLRQDRIQAEQTDA